VATTQLKQQARSKGKMIFIVLGVILSVVVLLDYFYFSSSNTNRDIVYRSRDYREPRQLVFDINNLPQPGDSEEEIYRIYGSDVDRRLTFKTTKKRTVNDTTFSFNKIISYQYYEYEYYSGRNEKLAYSGGEVKSVTEVVVYLLDNEVTFVSGKYQKKVGDDFITPDASINLSPNDKVWPEAPKDIAEYNAQ
jgi:hypothetical protein